MINCLKTFPDSRNFEPKTDGGFFDDAGYFLAVSKWFGDFRNELMIERLWCEAKIGNPTSSKVENDYFRGYMQGLNRILKGEQPTEIKRSLEDSPVVNKAYSEDVSKC
jgi:hypothetical protein